MLITISKPAEADVLSIASWYDAKGPGLGDRFVAEVERCYQFIIEFPEGSQRLDEGVRRALLKSFPYQIIYLPRSIDVFILGVLTCRIAPEHRELRSQP